MLLGVKLLRGTIIDDKDDHVEVDDANHHRIAGDSGATKHKAHAGMGSRGYRQEDWHGGRNFCPKTDHGGGQFVRSERKKHDFMCLCVCTIVQCREGQT